MVTHVHPSLSQPALQKTPQGERVTRLERMQDMLTAVIVIAAVALLAVVLVWYTSLYYSATHHALTQDTEGTGSNASNIIGGATGDTVPGSARNMQPPSTSATIPATGSTSVNTYTPSSGSNAATATSR